MPHPYFYPPPSDPLRDPAARPRRKGFRFRRQYSAAYTLVEIMVAFTVLAITTVSVTQALLQINKRAAISRVMNAAKAEALSRIQQVSQCSYDPDATPTPVIPTLLNTGTTTTNVDLGSTATGLGSIPATETWTVSSVSGGANILFVTCKLSYKYLNRNLSYELSTYKSPD